MFTKFFVGFDGVYMGTKQQNTSKHLLQGIFSLAVMLGQQPAFLHGFFSSWMGWKSNGSDGSHGIYHVFTMPRVLKSQRWKCERGELPSPVLLLVAFWSACFGWMFFLSKLIIRQLPDYWGSTSKHPWDDFPNYIAIVFPCSRQMGMGDSSGTHFMVWWVYFCQYSP